MYSNENYDEFEALLNDYLPSEEGKKERVRGVVAQKDRNFSYLEVKGQPTAIRVRSEEMTNYEVGDEVEVQLMGDTMDGDFIIGSRRKIEMEENWEKIEKLHQENSNILTKIEGKIKGGYVVNILGYKGFLPNSLSEIPMKDGDKAIGLEVEVIIKDLENVKNKKIIVSRKDVTEVKEKEEFAKLAIGEVVECQVSEVLDFGLVVRIGALKGFIHISEVSWVKVENLDSYKVGDKLTAKVIELEEEKRNIKLSLKAMSVNPWEEIAKTISVGSEVDAKVIKMLPYGIIVEIANGVEGLIHMNDFTWSKKKIVLKDFVEINDTIKVKVLEFEPEGRKLKLGIKQLSVNPWDNAEEKFAVGKELEAKIIEIKQFGLFAEVESGVDVFIHNSDYNWKGEETPKFNIGDVIKFEVIEVNTEDNKLKGSIKALRKSPWEVAMENYKVGQTVEKEIKGMIDAGLFVALSKGVDGFIPMQMASKDFIKNLKDKFSIGDVVKAQIVEIDKEKERIKLSIKKIELEEEKRENQELLSKYGTSSSEE